MEGQTAAPSAAGGRNVFHIPRCSLRSLNGSMPPTSLLPRTNAGGYPLRPTCLNDRSLSGSRTEG